MHGSWAGIVLVPEHAEDNGKAEGGSTLVKEDDEDEGSNTK